MIFPENHMERGGGKKQSKNALQPVLVQRFYFPATSQFFSFLSFLLLSAEFCSNQTSDWLVRRSECWRKRDYFPAKRAGFDGWSLLETAEAVGS